jgi:glyoxylase-like metal-dependent hydrolase (beta-lactamase superfamily II)
MKIMDGIYLIGSAQYGISASLDCHIYLIEDSGELAVIDIGAGKFDKDVDIILDNISKEGFSPSNIGKLFLTHAHSDHAGGAKAFKKKTGCRIIANSITEEMVKEADEHKLGLDFAKRSGFYGDDYKFKKFNIDEVFEDGEIMKIGKSSIKAILTPGHSIDSTCYLLEKDDEKILFTGDVVNIGGKFILLNCYGFSLEAYRENINKLSGLGTDIIFPGHGVYSLKDGQSHIDILIEAFDKLLINTQLIL